MLGYTERHHAKDWIGLAFVSVLYLAAFLFLAAVLIPGEFWRHLRRLCLLTQLALVVNYFTALLLTLKEAQQLLTELGPVLVEMKLLEP